MNFLVYRKVDGVILRSGGICAAADLELQANPNAGEIVIEDIWGDTRADSYIIVDGERVEITPQSILLPPATTLRSNSYPPIRDQLDALWHAMDDGLLPKVPAFYDPIAAVKLAYPVEEITK